MPLITSSLADAVDAVPMKATRVGAIESASGAKRCWSFSADFDARLQARIATLARARNPEAARARVEQEYRGAMSALRRGLAWRTALNAIATASVGGSVAVGVMTALPAVSNALGLGLTLDQTWTFGMGVIALAAGVLAGRAARSREAPVFT